MEESTVNEKQYDERLNIRTAGKQRGFHASLHHNRYEPTPYALLEILFDAYQLSPEDRLVDFGCGKGRLNFYVHHRFGAETAGVEMDETFYKEALENRTVYLQKRKRSEAPIDFCCCLAQDYLVQSRDNRFYFFNPFSVQIFMAVVNNILKSVEEVPRTVDLILFFPSDDYIDYLEHRTLFELAEEIPLPDIERDLRERFLVYRLG
jgi:SAM-dependent methyltransferase